MLSETYIIKHVLWALSMTAVAWWLNKSRLKRPNGNVRIMQTPAAVLIIGAACTSLFGFIAVMMQLYPGMDENGIPKPVDRDIFLALLGFSLLGLPPIRSYFVEQHIIGKDSLTYRTWTKRGVIRYRDIRRVRYSRLLKWFTIEGADDRVIRISIMMTGLQSFAKTILEKSSPDSMDVSTRGILNATAAGSPPSVWA